MEYYTLSFVRRAFEERVDAISKVLKTDSVILDLGCNDGRFSSKLKKIGKARRIIGIDLVEYSRIQGLDMEFYRRDLRTITLGDFLPVDCILVLNVVHHLVLFSRHAAKKLVRQSISTGADVFLDMGSFTERGPWTWRYALELYWSCDQEMWQDLFEGAQYRELLSYPAMGGGTRILWHLTPL